VHQQDTATRLNRRHRARRRLPHAIRIEVIQHLGQHDQVEASRRPFFRDPPALELHAGARRAGTRQRRLGHIQRQQPLAAPRQLRRQHADAAADLQRAGEPPRRQRGQGGGVFLRLVRAAGKTPWIGVGRIQGIEIRGIDGGSPAAHRGSR